MQSYDSRHTLFPWLLKAVASSKISCKAFFLPYPSGSTNSVSIYSISHSYKDGKV